ncbi:ferritin-like domain-containing protein [Anaerobacillus alkaliphilus]|uniref:Ferritin-like domain-containing protein n=1 Tax=Anaerobacillus alkaliphilus TaxID=1548597 RepID=A0A4Q0VRV2_9BACI|nr:ferritin-like domain-containing protein [Anaerobacillus alkaliphilus]RXJ00324.1 ferritin-like domain-containing protein [Anaerobacillus alkaliphilus]
MYFNNYRQDSFHGNSKILKLMTDVVRFEAITELTFDYLTVVAPTKRASMYLQSMLKDERDHIEEFKKIYFTLTGQQAGGDAPTFEIPESYEKGIQDIFAQKLDIIAIYKKIRQLSPYADLREKMNEFIQDEMRHLSMINHLLIRNSDEKRGYDFQLVPSYYPIEYS